MKDVVLIYRPRKTKGGNVPGNDTVGSEQIKDGSILLDDLSEELRASMVVGEYADDGDVQELFK